MYILIIGIVRSCGNGLTVVPLLTSIYKTEKRPPARFLMNREYQIIGMHECIYMHVCVHVCI